MSTRFYNDFLCVLSRFSSDFLCNITHFSSHFRVKSAAKVQYLFETRKYFKKKMQNFFTFYAERRKFPENVVSRMDFGLINR